jgi:uncharacterized RDD family membrane protein YckC
MQPWESSAANEPVQLGFETPENIRIRYPIAGAGTRFFAWLLDWLVVWVGVFAISVALLIGGAASGILESSMGEFDPNAPGPQSMMYFVGAVLLVMAFGSFAYYFLSELLMRGQTLGKWLLGLRVVKANGFSLDPLSLLVRNAFRVVDHLPVLWIIPVLSRQTQRPGDMAAGTVVVRDRPATMPRLRRELSGRDPLAARYRFDAAALGRLRQVDVEFLERVLDRWDDIGPRHRQRLLAQTLPPLSRRLRCDLPPPREALAFLEDLMAAEYRRRSHSVM